MKKLFKYFTFYDKVLIGIITFTSIIFILYPFFVNWNLFSGTNNEKEEDRLVVIQSQNEIVQRIPLDEEEESQIIEVDGDIGISKIEVSQSRVRIKEAPEEDPLRICEKTGWINTPGPSIVCVPNQITVWIEETENDDLDGVSW
ncbi:MAG: NusG domain II-containing protein [Halanaerobiales bacterium]